MTARVTTSQGGRDELEWLVATRTVEGELAAHVRSIYGYTEYAPRGLTRRELPAPQCVVIIEIGEPIRVYASGQERDWDRFEGGFVSGVDDSFTITSYRGQQSGIQLNLTPIGARLLLGIPMHHLASSVVALPELLPEATSLAAQLREDPSWEARFDRVERLFTQRLGQIEPRTRAVAWEFDELFRSRGRVPIASLCRELGYSQKHVIALFRDHIGVTPKQLARLSRFDDIVQALRSGTTQSWADLAIDSGFTDQAHLAREVSRFSGLTPTSLQKMLKGS